MERVRTYLNPIRAEQLKLIAEQAGFESIALYLDHHISREWALLNNEPKLPGFELSSFNENSGEHVVSLNVSGAAPIRITAREASQFGHGIKLVVNNEQTTFFIGSHVDPVILFFGKQGTGYQFVIKRLEVNKKIALSESISNDLSELFIYQSKNKDIK